VIIAVNLLLPWRAVHSAINGALVIAMYLIANAAWGGDFDTSVLINNVYFLGATVVIAVAINHLKHRLIEQEFHLRAELLDTNRHLDTSRLELKAARDALWGEMEIAKRIQTALLPKNRRLGAYDTVALMLPADEVGGDYYDLIETADGERWVAVGDVSGHGVESGLVMMMTQTSILSLVTRTPGLAPSAVFRSVNTVLRENISRLGVSRYMTLNVVRVHDDRLVLAGKHQDILIHRKATGRVETVTNEGSWVGVVADTQGFVEDQEIPVGRGDLILLFTDGVTEATAPSGEMFGQDRLERALARIAELALEDGLESLRAEVMAFQGKQDDDITLLLMRNVGA
jgi:phosphoserine phosphatase RsbU/P